VFFGVGLGAFLCAIPNGRGRRPKRTGTASPARVGRHPQRGRGRTDRCRGLTPQRTGIATTPRRGRRPKRTGTASQTDGDTSKSLEFGRPQRTGTPSQTAGDAIPKGSPPADGDSHHPSPGTPSPTDGDSHHPSPETASPIDGDGIPSGRGCTVLRVVFGCLLGVVFGAVFGCLVVPECPTLRARPPSVAHATGDAWKN